MKKMMGHTSASPTTTNILTFQNSLIKGLRYVLLALCVLGMVFCPVNTFADTYTLYTPSIASLTTDEWNDLDNAVLGDGDFEQLAGDSMTLPYDTDNPYNDIALLVDHYNIDLEDYVFVKIAYGNNVPYNYGLFAIQPHIVLRYGYNSAGNNLGIYAENWSNPVIQSLVYFLTYSSVSGNYTYNYRQLVTANSSVALYNTNFATNFQYVTFYVPYDYPYSIYWSNQNATTPTIPQYGVTFIPTGGNDGGNDIPSIDPSNPSVPSGTTYDMPLNIYYQLAMMFSMNFNCFTPNGEFHYNPSWVGVGQFLTYDYLCKTNKNSETVNVILADGTNTTLQNYLYGEPNYTAAISNIQANVATLVGNTSRTNQRLDTLDTHLTNKLDPITDDINQFTDKFNELYPDDAVELTSTIEEQIYDSDNGGLGLSDMQSTLSIKDDASDAFNVNVSLTQGISGMFDFLDTGEWGFWSNACKNDMDTTSQNRLMSEDVNDTLLQDKIRDFYDRLGLTYYGE